MNKHQHTFFALQIR
uniref:Uncharacterized protein n=1 Tax=Anguilla anguilla TaxID=7936 RepID=A0A0E9RNQ3_ANGAN